MQIKTIKTAGRSRADITTTMIKKFNDFLDTSVTQFTQGTPMLVNYYSIDTIRSTTGVGFNDNSGPYSGAIKFKKINNFHIYGYDDVVKAEKEKNEVLDDVGKIETTIALILPHTIKPKEDDRITFAIHNHSIIYKITNVNLGAYSNNPYYKIEYTVDTELPDSNFTVNKLDNTFVSEEYYFRYENIGTNLTPFIEKDNVDDYNMLLEYKDDLNNMYESIFYNEVSNTFLNEKEPGYFQYIVPLVDIQNEFKPILLYKNKVEAILHHETINIGNRTVNWVKSKIRKLLKRKLKDCESFIEEGITLYKYMYIVDRNNPTYSLVSYFNNHNKSYEIFDYNKFHINSSGESIKVPEEMKDLLIKYGKGEEKITFKELNEVLENYDIDVSLSYLLYTPILIIIINNVIRDELDRERLRDFV